MEDYKMELEAVVSKVEVLTKLINDYEGIPENCDRIKFLFASLEKRLQIIPAIDENRLTIDNTFMQLTTLHKRFKVIDEAVGLHPIDRPDAVPRGSKSQKYRYVPVSKWGIQFSGEQADSSLGAFLERVDELCVARNVSKMDLWLEAVDLFRGTALTWFRSVRKNIDSWEELVTELQLQFQPSNYDEDLLQEIRNRTQGENEPVGLFISAIDNLYDRLSYKVHRRERLRIMLRNLQPHMMEKLALHDIDSREKLLILGKKVEESAVRARRFKPPPSARGSLEPDLAYQGLTKSRAKVDEVHAPKVQANQEDNVPQIPRAICWNCRESGHQFRQCKIPKGEAIFCFGCGKRGVIQNHCPNLKCIRKQGNAKGQRV